jgi:hypothetical protein
MRGFEPCVERLVDGRARGGRLIAHVTDRARSRISRSCRAMRERYSLGVTLGVHDAPILLFV